MTARNAWTGVAARPFAGATPDGPPPAVYSPQMVNQYTGNPFIEALPPIRSRAETAELLAVDLPYSESDRTLPAETRIHNAGLIPGFFEPLGRHLDLDDRIARMIRMGYLARNPLSPRFSGYIQSGVAAVNRRPRLRAPWASVTSMTVIGVSGIGKTTSLEASLALYPQVVVHSEYNGQPLPRFQVTWLRLQCPSDGSLKALCMDFFLALDTLIETNYEEQYQIKRSTTDVLLLDMARVAAHLGLGLLVIDEIQALSMAGSGGQERMLNFFTQLVNMIGLPVVLVGTYRAQRILSGQFRIARRGAGQGDFPWDPMPNDETFRHFCESLWEYQYLREPRSLDNEILETLYDESQGITDIVVKLYVWAQQRAIETEKERITPHLIRSVALDKMRLARPMLQAIKTRNVASLAALDDVLPISLDFGRKEEVPVIMKAVYESTADFPPEETKRPGETVRLPGASTVPAEPAPSSSRNRRGSGRSKSSGGANDLRASDTLVAIAKTGHARKQSAHAVLATHGLTWDVSAWIVGEQSDRSPGWSA